MLSHLRATLFNRISTASSSTRFSTIASSSAPSQAQLKAMSVKDIVEKAIKDNKVVIFSKSYCPYCQKAKKLFKEKHGSVAPVVFELDERGDGSEMQKFLHQQTGQRTVPNIFVAQEHIGGCDDVFEAEESQKLARLLNTAKL